MGYDEKGIFVDLIFEKQKPKLRQTGKVLGMDRGYRCMLACSDGQRIGEELKEVIEHGGKRRKSYHHFIELLGLAGVYSLRSLTSGGLE